MLPEMKTRAPAGVVAGTRTMNVTVAAREHAGDAASSAETTNTPRKPSCASLTMAPSGS